MDDRGETAIPELEYRIRHADGSLRWFLTRGTVVRNPDGTLRRVVGTAIDVTERKKAELEAQEQRRELTHLARVAALGELSGALAHELNQPLTSILSNAEAARLLIEREPPDLHELGRILDDVISEDRRAGGVIRHLRSLLGKGPPHVESVDVPPLIQEILTVLNGDLVTRNITLQTSLPSGLPPVHADPVQLQQVLLNLVLNACDAMHGGASHERILIVSASRNESSVVVSVADRGTGIPPDRMEAIFRPFVTTKHKGLGLGLAISQSIVAAAGGRLWAENNPDRGATFRFELPFARVSQRPN
jgi:C4-dicarboxylate-specific signal transduction histidine kinase